MSRVLVTRQAPCFSRLLVPAERGSIAVLTRDRVDVDAVAAMVLAAIGYVD